MRTRCSLASGVGDTLVLPRAKRAKNLLQFLASDERLDRTGYSAASPRRGELPYMVSMALREAARLSRKALAAARLRGIAGLARATGRHVCWRLGLNGYANWRDGRIDRRFGIDTRGIISNLD